MNQSERIEQKQLQGLVFAAFLTDSFIQPFGQRNSVLPARMAILSSGLQLAVLALVVGVFLAAWNRNETWAFLGQQGLLALGVLLIFATGRERKKR